MNDIISALTDRDEKKACELTKQIASSSEISSEYYAYIEYFASLLTDKSSYVRTRAFILCCCQARWDSEGRIRNILPAMTKLFYDPKPTVVRQCLNAVKELILFRPELACEIEKAISEIDLSRYRNSMSPLIEKDIRTVAELLKEKGKND